MAAASPRVDIAWESTWLLFSACSTRVIDIRGPARPKRTLMAMKDIRRIDR